MKIKNIIVLLLATQLFWGMTACNNATIGKVGNVTNQEVDGFKTSINLKGATLVDIRTPKEYAEGHIEGAIMVDWKNKTFKNYVLNIPQTKPIVIYCRSGNRSGKAASALQALGYTDIYNLASGIKGWKNAGQPVVTNDNAANIAFQKKASVTTNDVEAAMKKMEKRGLGRVSNISTDAFHKAIASGNVVLVDVRTQEEYDAGHIKGAKLVDWKKRSFKDLIAKEDVNKDIYIYCRSGNRSGKSAATMQAMGFKNVYNLSKGIKGWKSMNLPLEK